MSKHMLGLAVAAAMAFAATSAHAVDIRNNDDEIQDIVLSVWKDQAGLETTDTLITLAPGEVRTNVCTMCIVSLGKDEDAESVAAENMQIVTVIKGGKLSIDWPQPHSGRPSRHHQAAPARYFRHI